MRSRELVAEAEAGRPGRGPGRRTRPRWSRRTRPASRRLGRRAGRDRASACSPRSRRALGRGVRRGARRGRSCCSGSPSTSSTTTYLGTSTGLRLRHVQPTGRVELNGKCRRLRPRRPGPAPAPRDFADVDVAALDAELAARLGLGASGGSSCRPAATRRCCRRSRRRRPADLRCTGRASARDADEGRTVFGSPAAATGSASGWPSLPLTLRSDPAAPGLECAPFVVAPAVRRRTPRSSTTGCRCRATTGSRTARWRNLIRPRHCAPTHAAAGHAADRQPVLEARRRRRPAGRDGRRAPSAGCC